MIKPRKLVFVIALPIIISACAAPEIDDWPPPLFSVQTDAQDMASRKSPLSGRSGGIFSGISEQRHSLGEEYAEFRQKSPETIFDAQNFEDDARAQSSQCLAHPYIYFHERVRRSTPEIVPNG